MTTNTDQIRTVSVSACDQTVHVILRGYRFNASGDLMGRPSISKPDKEAWIPMKKGERLDDVLPYRNNGIDLLNAGDLKFEDVPAVFERDYFACGGWTYNRAKSLNLMEITGAQEMNQQ